MFSSISQKKLYAPLTSVIQHTLGLNVDLSDQDVIHDHELQLPHTDVLSRHFNVLNHNHKTLKFLPQNDDLPFKDMSYEQRIFETGIIATRNNWHDYFNAMVWKVFPQTKSALNAIHHREGLKQTSNHRTRKRDLLTLFDECGIIVIADQTVLDMIRNHQWQSLFVDHKHLWLSHQIQAITFGHAMYEKYLNPYIGMTAQAILLPAQQFSQQDTNNAANIDQYLATHLTNETLLNTKKDLCPLPVLGIPEWYSEQDEAFYANQNYFRPAKNHE